MYFLGPPEPVGATQGRPPPHNAPRSPPKAARAPPGLLFVRVFEGNLNRLFSGGVGEGPSWHAFGKAWQADLMHIYVSLALLACLWKGLASRSYAYLRESRPLGMSLERPGKQILCIFT